MCAVVVVGGMRGLLWQCELDYVAFYHILNLFRSRLSRPCWLQIKHSCDRNKVDVKCGHGEFRLLAADTGGGEGEDEDSSSWLMKMMRGYRRLDVQPSYTTALP